MALSHSDGMWHVIDFACAVYNSILKAMQLIFVDRSSASSRRAAATAIVDRVRSPLAFPPVVVFPEGTVGDSNGRGDLLPFRTGAFAAGMPCQPVLIRYPSQSFEEASGALDEMLQVMKLMFQASITCEVKFLPVYNPTAEERSDPKLYAETVRSIMSHAMV